MAAEVKKEIELEIAHVLFIDIVGYSKLSANEQHARISELNEVVRLSEQFRKAEAAGRILKIPTGDGMALVFYKSPEEPAQCAFEIAYVYAFCGDADKAFEWLDKAVAYQDPGLSEIVPENLFDKIHSDPRWLPFLRKIGKAPDQLAKIEFKVPPLPQ